MGEEKNQRRTFGWKFENQGKGLGKFLGGGRKTVLMTCHENGPKGGIGGYEKII